MKLLVFRCCPFGKLIADKRCLLLSDPGCNAKVRESDPHDVEDTRYWIGYCFINMLASR